MASQLACERDDRLLFQDLDFELQPHQVLLVEGANGSGKTSLLKILCGIRMQEQGEVSWCGEPINRLAFSYFEQLAYVGHTNGIKQELTVMENLQMVRAFGRSGDLSFEQVLEKVGLTGYEDVFCYMLSAGQRRRVALARLLVTRAQLWVLDEPFTSLDKHSIAVFEAIMEEHTAAGGMVVLTSHHDVNLPSSNLQRINLSA